MNGAPECVLDEEMLTMRPQPASTMSGRTAWVVWKTPCRLMSMILRHSSKLMLANRRKTSLPAALTRMVTGPSAVRAASETGAGAGSTAGGDGVREDTGDGAQLVLLRLEVPAEALELRGKFEREGRRHRRV